MTNKVGGNDVGVGSKALDALNVVGGPVSWAVSAALGHPSPQGREMGRLILAISGDRLSQAELVMQVGSAAQKLKLNQGLVGVVAGLGQKS